MMISPASYVQMNEDKSFEALIKERKSLCREIARLEKIVFDKDHSDKSWQICPGPDVQYQVNLEYLAELCLFIRDKYNEEIVYGNEEDEEDCLK